MFKYDVLNKILFLPLEYSFVTRNFKNANTSAIDANNTSAIKKWHLINFHLENFIFHIIKVHISSPTSI